ncbi:hypothetical protein KQX54_019364 [Cotesia glomerata]|uniref:Uncharacterized protein n=1 Tax=Cotesia glomerata TaxID=32391 RepID=A0AAV7J210_COTGL|nr:hypothetical protein KQX54_019364 [Cotesia glomerata]
MRVLRQSESGRGAACRLVSSELESRLKDYHSEDSNLPRVPTRAKGFPCSHHSRESHAACSSSRGGRLAGTAGAFQATQLIRSSPSSFSSYGYLAGKTATKVYPTRRGIPNTLLLLL